MRRIALFTNLDRQTEPKPGDEISYDPRKRELRIRRHFQVLRWSNRRYGYRLRKGQRPRPIITALLDRFGLKSKKRREAMNAITRPPLVAFVRNGTRTTKRLTRRRPVSAPCIVTFKVTR